MPARGANDTYGSSKSAGKGPDRRAPAVNRELIRTFTKAKPTNHAQAPRSDSANARGRMPAVRRDGKLSGQRPGDRPADTATRAVRRRRHLRTAGQGGDGRLGRQIHDRSGEARHIPAVGVDAGLSERAHSGIHRFGRHAVHRNRARKRSAGNRNGHGHALSRPPHGGKSGQRPNDRVARNREKPGFEPRHRPHRTLLSRSLVFARRLPQRPDRARRRAVGEPLLHGRNRDTQHQSLRDSGSLRRPGEPRQLGSDPRNRLLYGSFPRRPGRSAELGAGFPAPRRRSRPSAVQGDARRLGGRPERQRPHRQESDLSLFGPAILPSDAVQAAGPTLPAELHRRSGESQNPLLATRRADRAGAGRHRQHAAQYGRKGRGNRIPAKLSAPAAAGNLHRRRVVPALCRAARADRHAEPLLSQ